MLLGQAQAEQLRDHGREAHALQAQQARGELGVEDVRGPEPVLGQAGQVLRRGVQHPLGVAHGVADRRQVGQGDRVEQRRAGALAPQLHQVGGLAVAVARGALRVGGDGAGAGREPLDHAVEGGRGVDDAPDAVRGLGERDDVGGGRGDC